MKWPMLSFAKVADVITGNTPSKQEQENYGDGVPWVKPCDLDNYEPVIKTAENLSEIGQKKARLLPPNTVMVCCIGSIGKVGISGTTVATNQQINSLIFNSYIEPRFGYYYCRYITPIFQAEARKAVVAILNKSNFEKIKIPVPPLSEQRRIVEILDQADDLRRKQAEAAAKADRILPALFIKMFGDPATNPMGWEIGKIGSVILSTQYGTSVRANTEVEGIPILRMNNINFDGRLNLKPLKYVVLEPKELEKYLLQPGDLLFNRTNSKELVGKTGLWKINFHAVPASYLIRIRVNLNKVMPEYLWAYMNTYYIKKRLFEQARRAIGMANINAEELRALPVMIPAMSNQYLFVERVKFIDYLLDKRNDLNEKINALFDTLLQRAFSGELTAKWREAHMKELLAEMEAQAKAITDIDENEQLSLL